MKAGKTLHVVAQELERIRDNAVDYLADSSALTAEARADDVAVLLGDRQDGERFGIRRTAHSHLSGFCEIPARYYNRLLNESRELWAENVNHWLRANSRRRFVRTLDGHLRAFLSDQYRPLDNWEFANAVLPVVAELGGKVESCEITEKRLYLKVVRPDLQAEIMAPNARWGRGHDRVDIVQAGLVLSNSEVGCGRIAVQPAIHTTACTNMMISKTNVFAKTHLGRRLGGGDDDGIERWLSDATRRQRDQVVWAELRDVARAALDGRIFHETVKRLREARQVDLVQKDDQIIPTVEKVANHYGIRDNESEGVLDYFIKGGDLTWYGMHSAVTRYAQDVDSYDRSTELEEIGGRMIETPTNKVRRLLAAVPSAN